MKSPTRLTPGCAPAAVCALLLCLNIPTLGADDATPTQDPRDARIQQLTARVERLEALVGRTPGTLPPSVLTPSLDSRIDRLEHDVQALNRRADPGPGAQDQSFRDLLRSLREVHIDLRSLNARVDRIERESSTADSLRRIQDDMSRLRRELDRVRSLVRDSR